MEFYRYDGQYSVTITPKEFRVVELKDIEDLTTRDVASRRKVGWTYYGSKCRNEYPATSKARVLH